VTRFLDRVLVGVFAGALLLLLTAGSAAPSSASITATNYVIWGAGGVDPGHFYGARGIAVGPYGDLVYVADTGNNRIEAFTPEGIYLYKWGHFGKGSGDFDKPVRRRSTGRLATTVGRRLPSTPRRSKVHGRGFGGGSQHGRLEPRAPVCLHGGHLPR
jgi:hypothetical protein